MKTNYRIKTMYPTIMEEHMHPRDETEWRKCFGAKLYKLLEMRCMTITDLSDYTGISTTTLSAYINGKNTPSGYKLMKIASALEYNPEDLMIL